MATEKKRKINYFRINDPKLNKLFWWMVSALFAIATVTLFLCAVALISSEVSEPEMSIYALIPQYLPFLKIIVAIYLVLSMAILTVFIYNYATNKEAAREQAAEQLGSSPLNEEGMRHEAQIIAMLKSVAKPNPGTSKLNRANTVHFLRVLVDMGLIDSNLSGKHLMLWVTQATGYEENSPSGFNQAIKTQKRNEPLEAQYRQQLEQMIAD